MSFLRTVQIAPGSGWRPKLNLYAILVIIFDVHERFSDLPKETFLSYKDRKSELLTLLTVGPKVELGKAIK